MTDEDGLTDTVTVSLTITGTGDAWRRPTFAQAFARQLRKQVAILQREIAELEQA